MDYPEPTPAPLPPLAPDPALAVRDNSWAAITSLVLGILSLCGAVIPICNFLIPVAGLIFGFIGLKSRQRTLAIIGMILSALVLIGLVILTILGVGISLLDPNTFNFEY
jgi:hypothetical protein